MKLKLDNIGIIKYAEIEFNGLTVIAGENDSGKSTVGKVLYSLIKTIKWSSNTDGSGTISDKYCNRFNRYINSLFKHQISDDGKISFDYDSEVFTLTLKKNLCHSFDASKAYSNSEPKTTTPLLIDSPYIWNIMPSLKTIRNLEAHKNDIDFEVLETLKDLYFALNIKLKESSEKIKVNIGSIINGNFQENSLGDFVFKKDEKSIELINTAMGIKYFGILQVLSDKNHFYSGQILILDEPEVHLHPNWQLKLAEVIVYLVKNGVKIIVNSHSPYMIEALQRYSEIEKIPFDFYLAHNAKIEKLEDSNSRTLSAIFEKLSEPYDIFEKMESDRL